MEPSTACGFADARAFQRAHRQWVEYALASGTLKRDERWSESIAGGGHGFVEAMKRDLGIAAPHRTADGTPNYVQSSVIAGIGGRALFFGRPKDSFGLGAFRYTFSDALQNSLASSTKFRDEAAVEAFYSYAVTPWLYVGPDIQYIKPAAGGYKNALVATLRTQIRF